MSVLPIFVGSALGGFTWWQLLLLVSWLAAFLAFDALGSWIRSFSTELRSRRASANLEKLGLRSRRATLTPRTRRSTKFLAPLFTYGALGAVGGGVLLWHLPRLAWFAIPMVAFFTLVVWQMWIGKPRSFVARACAITASCLLAPIAYQLGAKVPADGHVWVATVVLIAYFIGTIGYVKTMIRERGDAWWLTFSTSYHLSCSALALAGAVSAATSWWVFVAALVLAVRAWGFPHVNNKRVAEGKRPLAPALFGSSEFVFSAMVAAALLVPA